MVQMPSTSTSGSAYLSTRYKDISHDEFTQDFEPMASTSTFKIIYTFGSGTKTVRQPFDSAVASGESVNWTVFSYSSATYSYSGLCVTPMQPQHPQSGTQVVLVSPMMMELGGSNGTIDGDSPGPYLGTSGWGHQNANGGDSECATYYFSGTSSLTARQNYNVLPVTTSVQLCK